MIFYNNSNNKNTQFKAQSKSSATASLLLTTMLASALLLGGCNDDDNSNTEVDRSPTIVESHPAYYGDIDPIRMQDNLAKTLGASDGYYEYHFIDAAKTAGHVCPAVAGAWMESVIGLKALYGEQTPIRGRIHVTMKGSQDDGFTGAMANVISLITGVTDQQGFGGIFGVPEYNRQNLLAFKNDKSEGPMYTIFTKLDESQQPEACVKVMYNPGAVLFKEAIRPLMKKVKMGTASDAEKIEFASLWQERVQRMMIDNFQTNVNPKMIYTVACDIDTDL